MQRILSFLVIQNLGYANAKTTNSVGLHFFKHGWVDDLKRDQTQNYKAFTRRKNTAVDNSPAAVCCYVFLHTAIIHNKHFHTAIFCSRDTRKGTCHFGYLITL